MMVIDENRYKILNKNFLREYGRIEPYKARRPLTEDLELRIEYKECIVETYNENIIFLKPYHSSLSSEDKIDIQNRINEHLKKLKDCFRILHLEYTFSLSIWDTIDIDSITEKRDSQSTSGGILSNLFSSFSSTQTKPQSQVNIDKDKNETENNQTKQTENIQQNTPPVDDIGDLSGNPTDSTDTMAQTVKEFMALAHQTIDYRYNGKPLDLDSFIDAIELLEELCDAQNVPTMLKFVKTRLCGNAREIIKEPKTIKEIKDTLRDNCTAESAQVIEGRLLTLRMDKTNLSKFSERAEELANELRRSLVTEGYSKEKAKEVSINKTVDLCRINAKSDAIYTILGSTKFTEPKDVVAKMIIEINNLKQLRNQSRNATPKNSHSNNKFHKNGNRNFNQNFNNNRGAQGARPNGNNNGRNFHGNNNRNGQNSGRSFTNSNYRRPNNDQPIRMVSGNETLPGNGGQMANQSQQN